MLDLADLELNEGEAPKRPSWLSPLDESLLALTPDAFYAKLATEGLVLVYGGMSIIGPSGYFVYTLGIMSSAPEDRKAGWYLLIGHPEIDEPDFIYFDEDNPVQHVPFPNTMVYFLGQGDRAHVVKDASHDDLKEMARFVLPFIADADIPEGTDWPQERVFA